MGNNKPLLWTAILTAAGASSANAQITGTPTDGETFYFKDVETGRFLGGSNAWGTRASLVTQGMEFKVELNDGKYALKSSESTYFGENLFVDGSATGKAAIEIEELAGEKGKYILKMGNNYFKAVKADAETEARIEVDADIAKAVKWQLFSVKDYLADFSKASFENPVNATFLIKNPTFTRPVDTNVWKGTGSLQNVGSETHANTNVERWSGTLDMYQELSGLPTGTYRLTAQIFYRNGGFEDAGKDYVAGNEVIRASLYAGNSTVLVPSICRDAQKEWSNAFSADTKTSVGFVPNMPDQASRAFEAGYYKSEPVYAYVGEDGKLTIGVKKTEKRDNDWLIFDNFELFYVGNINVDAFREELTNKLAVQINKAGKYTDDETLQNLAVKAAELQTVINTLTSDNADAYTIIANYQSGVKGNIGEQIEELGADITKATKNYEAYAAAQKDYKETLTPKLANLETECQKVLDDKDTPQDVKDNVKSIYDGIAASVEKFMTDADAAYKAGTAGDSFSDANRKNRVDDLLKAIEDGIGDGSANALSYIAVNNAVVAANAEYSLKASELYSLLAGAKDGATYEDTYQDALKDLSAVKRAINKIAEENKANYDAQKATEETRDKALADLNVQKTEMSKIYSKYLEKVGSATEEPAKGTLRANYIAANADVKGISDDLKTKVEDKFTKRDEVKKFYDAQVTEIKNDIKALQANVDAANAAHTIKGVAPFCDKYNEDKDAISKKIADLQTKVDKSASEFDANANSLAAIKTVETKYNETKGGKKDVFVGVDNQKQDDYTTKGRFAASEKAITDAVAALKAAAANAYKVDGTGTAADFFSKIAGDQQIKEGDKEITLLGTTSIDGKIDAYKKNAVDAFDAYKKVAAALAKYDLALNGKPAKGEEGKDGYEPAEPGLKGTATNTEVTVDGTYAGQTYAAAISAIEKRIKVVSDTLANANKEQDVKHTQGIVGIKLDNTLVDDINTLTNNYKANEEAWNKAQVAAAKDRLVEEANRYVTTINSSLPQEAYKAAEYGKAADMLNNGNGKEGDEELKGYNKLKEEANAIQAKIDQAVGKGDAEAIAVLSEVVKDAKKVNDSVTKLVATAADAKKEFEADQKALATLNGTVSEVRAMLNGGEYNKVKYDGVKKAAGDKDYFTEEISNVNTLINAASTEITTSGTNETVRVDQEDKKEGDKVTKKGYTTRLAEIKTQINNLLSLAANEKANDAAFAAFNKDLTDAKVSDAITAAETALADDKVCTGDGRAFFQGELKKYKAEYTKVSETDRDAAYGAKVESTLAGALEKNKKYTDTAKNMVANQKSLTDRLNTVKANITGLKALAEANEKAHNDQVVALDGNETVKGARSQWQEVFDEVANSEQSSAHEAAIKELTEIKKKLDAYETAIADNFAKGTSDTKKVDLQAQIDECTRAIKELSDGWEDKYNAAIAADNTVRKTAFDAAYASLIKTYQDKTALVNDLSKLSYASDASDILGNITGPDGIYSYIDKIRKLKTEADKSAQETAKGQLWDGDENYKKEANNLSNKISELAAQYSSEVNRVAEVTYNEKYTEATNKLNAAKTQMANTLHIAIDGENMKEGVKDVQEIITDAEKKAAKKDGVFVNENFAILLEDILANFAKIDNMLVVDKENTAVAVWNKAISGSNTLAEKELEAIKGFGVDKLIEKDENKYSTKYSKNEIANINKAAEEWAKIEDGKKYANYATAWTELNKFVSTVEERQVGEDKDKNPIMESHTVTYWNVKASEDERVANDTYYQGVLKDIEGLQAKHDVAEAYVYSLMIQHDASLNETLNGESWTSIQRRIDDLNWFAEYYKGAFGNWHKDYIQTQVGLVSSIADNVYPDAIKAEYAALKNTIGVLYKELDLAIAEDITNTELDKYKTVIDGYYAENDKIHSERFTGIVIGHDEKTDTDIYQLDKDGNIVLISDADAQARYIALEKKIGVTNSELVAVYDEAGAANALAAVNAEIAKLDQAIADMAAQMADSHAPVQDKYQADADALAANVEALKAIVANEVEDNTVLLYQDNNIKSAKAVADMYKTLSEEMAIMEAPYDVNDAALTRLSGELDALQNRLDQVVETAKGYEYAETNGRPWTPDPENEESKFTPEYQIVSVEISRMIQAKRKDLAEQHDKFEQDADNNKLYQLTEDTQLDSYINDEIDKSEKDMAFDNQYRTWSSVNSVRNAAITNADKIMNHKSPFEERFYPDYATYQSLKDTNDELRGKLVSAATFASNVHQYGKSDIDIEGNRFVDPEDEAVSIMKEFDYMTEYPAIMAKFAELKGLVEAFDKDVLDKSCRLGDLDNSNEINVNDYNTVRNIIIGAISKDDLTPAQKLSADVNGDGLINIADVIQIANYIMTEKFDPEEEEDKTEAAKSRIAARMAKKSEGNALSISAEGTGMKQTITVAIAKTQNFVGAELDIELPAGVNIVGEGSVDGHDYIAGEVDGVRRIVLSSLENEEFSDNNLVTIEVEVTSEYKGDAVKVSRAIFADARGSIYSLDGTASDGATGITELTFGEKVMSKMYSVGGQLMNGLKKGIGVIVNPDGTAKKVFNK